jgi:hypothetical protein
LETEIRELRAAADRQQGKSVEGWVICGSRGVPYGNPTIFDVPQKVNAGYFMKRCTLTIHDDQAPEQPEFDVQSARQAAIESFRSDLANPLTGALNEIERLRAALAAKENG